jgi:hypothetical protein
LPSWCSSAPSGTFSIVAPEAALSIAEIAENNQPLTLVPAVLTRRVIREKFVETTPGRFIIQTMREQPVNAT